MEIGINDLSHAVRIMTGFEAYANGNVNSDVAYAKTCLRLNGLNLDSYKGTEGFMDSVKAGGKKMYEMIVKFLKAVKNFFFGVFGVKRDKAVKDAEHNVADMIKDIDTATEASRKNKEAKDVVDAVIKQSEQLLGERKATIEERPAYQLENWNNFTKRFSESIWKVKVSAITTDEIPGISLSIKDNEDVAKVVTTHLVKLKALTSFLEGTVTGDIKSVKALQNLNPLLTTLVKVRDGAKQLLAGATTDLERNNAVYDKLENKDYKASEVNLRNLNTETAALIDKMTKLVALCERDIATIEKGVSGIAKKIKIEDVPTSNLEEFDKFMNE